MMSPADAGTPRSMAPVQDHHLAGPGRLLIRTPLVIVLAATVVAVLLGLEPSKAAALLLMVAAAIGLGDTFVERPDRDDTNGLLVNSAALAIGAVSLVLLMQAI